MKKTQAELEQPVKGYQLDAVEAKVDQALIKLDSVIQQTQGIVTRAELEREIKDAKKEVHLEYGPMKKNLDWFIKAIVLEGFAIIGQVIALYLIARG